MVFGNYSYDALGKRIRLKEAVSFDNRTFRFDALLLYKEVMKIQQFNHINCTLQNSCQCVFQRVMYSINNRSRTCIKKPLNVDFHPLGIPKNASLLGQVVLGSSSGPKEGLLVNTWAGETQMKKGTGTGRESWTNY